jgi:hypothetical protein
MKEITSDLRLKEVKYLHEVEVILHVKIGIPEDKRVTVRNIITAVKGLGIEPIFGRNNSPLGVIVILTLPPLNNLLNGS